MTLTSKQKAAMLLMSLDVTTATELIKGFPPEQIQELAVELSYLNAAGYCSDQQRNAITSEFYEALQEGPQFKFDKFLDQMLKGSLGDNKAQQVQSDIHGLLKAKDPFLAARTAKTEVLISVLETEHPQAIAVILAELPAKRSSEVLGGLPEGVRLSAISRMATVNTVTHDAKNRIAEMVGAKLDQATTELSSGIVKITPEQSIRKVAVVLRNLETELRNNVLNSVGDNDPDTAESVREMMVVWDDISVISDRSMQEALRGIEEQKLALALHEADTAIADKIKGNISERAAAMVDEEASLMTAPKTKDINEARSKIIGVLRDLNSKGELMFEG